MDLKNAYPMTTTVPMLEIPFTLTAEEIREAITEAVARHESHQKWLRNRIKQRFTPVPGDIESKFESYGLDRESVLNAFNKRKYIAEVDRLAHEEKVRQMQENRSKMRNLWTPEEMYRHLCRESMRRKGRKFIYEEENNGLAVKALCFRLADSDRFEKDLGLDPAKGIIMRGRCGVGKTFLVECLSNNPLNPISCYTMSNIAKNVSVDQFYTIKTTRPYVYIEDILKENTNVKVYGNGINWFKDFIEQVYKNPASWPRLIICTNNDWEDIAKAYGEHVRDRMAEMFNNIPVLGKSKRRK